MCERTKALNDFFRENWELGRVVCTNSIAAMPDIVRAIIMYRVRTYKDFTSDNDPHGEHDFGSFEQDGEKLFWKIDYFNRDMSAGSNDPANPDETTRVLTIMLASEY